MPTRLDTKAPSTSQLPSFAKILKTLGQTWMTAAAAGTVGRPYGAQNAADGFAGGGQLSQRTARALMQAEGPAPQAPALAVAPAPAHGPDAGVGLRPASAPTAAQAPSVPGQPAPLPSTGVVLPVSVSGNHFVDGNGEPVFLIGVNLAANDACGVGERSTEDTLSLYRAFAQSMSINFIAQHIIVTPKMLQNPNEMDVFVDIARRVNDQMPGMTLIVRPLADVGLDDRAVPTPAFNAMMADFARRVRGLPVALSLGKELHRNSADYGNKTSNEAVNAQMRNSLTAAYQTVRAANPDIMLLLPGVLDPQSGAQYSRSAAGWRDHFSTYTNAAVAIDLYTTGATETEQMAQVNAWGLNHTDALPVIVAELAPYQAPKLGVNMTEGVFNRTFQAFVNRGVPVALWDGEDECHPSMVDQPYNPAKPLTLNHWGEVARSWVRSYIG